MAAASERVFEFLNEEEEDQTVEHPADVSAVTGTVDFDHVQFGYNPDQTIIKDFSAHVKPGQKIAIVGPTGAGKTTMVKLLMRFYDVNSGSIKLDGHDVRDFNRRELRDAFGMVLQDTWLFKGTIMENIRYGRLEATDEEVIAAAKAAHADHFIKTLPGGYQMELNEDASNVSQGQKQLLTIARAILADNKILILDEPTAGLDPNERIRFRNLISELSQDRLVLLSTHIVSDIEYIANQVLLMKDGKISHSGTQEEIIQSVPVKVWSCVVANNEVEMWQKQFKVSNMKTLSDGIELRILSEKSPHYNAKEETMTLEDIFLYYFGEKTGDDYDVL